MDTSELEQLELTSDEVPKDWVMIQDPDTTEVRLIILPKWLAEKMKTGRQITEQEFSRYKSECHDLMIDAFFQKSA